MRDARTFVKITLLFAAISFAAIQPHILAQTTARKIDELMTLSHKNGLFDGAVLVVERGKIIYRRAFGYANKEWNIPNTPDTKFRIASITKSFTSTLIFQLIEQGKLKLDGRLSDYLPAYPKAKGDKITIHNLLTHTAGLRDITDFPRGGNNFPAIIQDTDDLVRMISSYDLLFEPGSGYRYSNDGYILLGAIIEKVTGKPYAKVLEEQILTPLGMKNSGMAYLIPLISKRAAGYEHTFYGDENATPIGAGAAGGMYSTVDDLLLFNQGLAGNKLLSKKSKDLLFSFSPYNSVYGWKVRKITDSSWKLVRTAQDVESDAGWKGDKVIITDGLIPGFISSMVWQVEANRLIVLLTNVRLTTPTIVDIGFALTKILDGKPYEAPKRSLAESLFSTIRQSGIEAALRQYRDLRGDKTYNVSESELNSVGYLLLYRERKVREAIEIFKLNVEAYPQSANAYDSLGEAYMMNGDKELAIKNYQRSLDLNPQNTNAAEMLKKLRAH